MTVATFTQIPEAAIDEQDAKAIAKATAELVELHGGGIDPRAMAWTNLILTLGAVYGPRALMYYARTKAEKEEREKRTPAARPG